MTSDARRRAQARGATAEHIAAWWLRFKGYRILAHGFRVAAGEVDLIARRGRVLTFVEVKRRQDQNAAAAAITPVQQKRIVRAAQAFLQQRPELAHLRMRFDAVLIFSTPWPKFSTPRHIEDAWRIT